jgi:hypothetical protein
MGLYPIDPRTGLPIAPGTDYLGAPPPLIGGPGQVLPLPQGALSEGSPYLGVLNTPQASAFPNLPSREGQIYAPEREMRRPPVPNTQPSQDTLGLNFGTPGAILDIGQLDPTAFEALKAHYGLPSRIDPNRAAPLLQRIAPYADRYGEQAVRDEAMRRAAPSENRPSVNGGRRNVDFYEMDPGMFPGTLAGPPPVAPQAPPPAAPQAPPQAPQAPPATPVAAPPAQAPQAPPQAPQQQGPEAPPAQAPAVTPITAAQTHPFADASRGIISFEHGGSTADPFNTPGRSSNAWGAYQIMPKTYEGWARTYSRDFQRLGLPSSFEEFRRLPADRQRAAQESLYNEVIFPREYAPTAEASGRPLDAATAATINFMGPTGARNFWRFYQNSPGSPITAVGVTPDQIRANSGIYGTPENPATVAEVYDRIQRRATGQGGGALREPLTQAQAGGSTPPQAAAAQGNPQTGDQNPYRERLAELLQGMEGERRARPEMGEVLFRMGTGILGGRNMAEGFSQGGRLVNEYFQQNRQNNQATDQRLMTGYGALSRDRDYQNRTRYGTPTNVRWLDQSGKEQQQAGRIIDGEPHLQNGQGQWVPAFQVTGTNRMEFIGRNDRMSQEEGVDGIINARGNAPTQITTRDGRSITIDNPFFDIPGSEANQRYLQAQELVRSGVRLEQMERSGIDPSAFAQAITNTVSRSPQGANVATVAAELARISGLSNEEARLYTVNMRRFLNANGRMWSGAAITRDEWGQFEASVMPRYGDTRDVVEELSRIRQSQMRAAAAAQGPAAAFLNDVIAGKRYLEAPYEGRRTAPSGQPQERPRETTQPAQQEAPATAQRLDAGKLRGSAEQIWAYVNSRPAGTYTWNEDGQPRTGTAEEMKSYFRRRLGMT